MLCQAPGHYRCRVNVRFIQAYPVAICCVRWDGEKCWTGSWIRWQGGMLYKPQRSKWTLKSLTGWSSTPISNRELATSQYRQGHGILMKVTIKLMKSYKAGLQRLPNRVCTSKHSDQANKSSPADEEIQVNNPSDSHQTWKTGHKGQQWTLWQKTVWHRMEGKMGLNPQEGEQGQLDTGETHDGRGEWGR